MPLPLDGLTVAIIGAGPAGLTAAYELVTRSAARVLVLEKDEVVGGLARTVPVNGNRLDVGGHRFFSKSRRVTAWWLSFLPLASATAAAASPVPAAGAEGDRAMLLRERRSRIYYRRRFFPYPITLGWPTLRDLGLRRAARIGLGYLRARALPIRPERSLEDLLINRFGAPLYRTFFESYTEKVWGVPCREIAPDWGRQRMKGLTLGKTLWNALLLAGRPRGAGHSTETSLIERFLYPKRGPGQLWETVAERVTARGGSLETAQEVTGLRARGDRIVELSIRDGRGGKTRAMSADIVLSSMPLRDLVAGLDEPLPEPAASIGSELRYRDFLTVGLLLDAAALRDPSDGRRLRDNWIYIQDPDARAARLQVFNNWSPWMVADPEKTTWVGMEYFCQEGDSLWAMEDRRVIELAAEELERIGLCRGAAVRDAVVLRVPKAYPSYIGEAYGRLGELRAALDRFDNLFPIGRNGQHRYNNMDHSMLTALEAVDGLLAGRVDRDALWGINAEPEHHEKGAMPGV